METNSVPEPGLAPPSAAGGSPARGDLLFAAVVAVLVAAGLFLLQGRIDFNVADEGFVWYGCILTAVGKVPLRDFYSYDPGRYYWVAAFSPWLGQGILAMRIATVAFQALGLFCGLMAARRLVRSRWLLFPIGLLLALWMSPRIKYFDCAIALAAVYVAVLLLEKPTRARHFGAGALVGGAAFFGKNHGLYTLLAYLVLLLWLHYRRLSAGSLGGKLLAWTGGIAAGALPLLVLMAAAPGFLRSYVNSALFFVAQGRTNQPLPVPWPWVVSYGGLGGEDALLAFSLGLGFLTLPVAAAAALLFLPATTAENLARRRVLLAAGAVGLFYLHHAFARADDFHLSQSIHPILLVLLALPLALAGNARRFAGGLTLSLLLFLTLFTALPQSPWVQKISADGRGERFVRFLVGSDRLWLRERTARLIRNARSEIDPRVPAGSPVLMVPFFPGLYPVLGRVSPISDFYPMWPAQGERDLQMLREIQGKNVEWALYSDQTVDDREETRFSSTHPQVWSYLEKHFQRVPSPRLPRRVWLMQRRGPFASPR